MQPVCTTEIGRLAIKYDELSKMGVKLATLSCDKVCGPSRALSRAMNSFIMQRESEFVQSAGH